MEMMERKGMEWRVSVFNGESSLDGVIAHEEVEDEHAVQNWEDLPAHDYINL